jgi:zinc-ribbon domain
MQKSPRPIGVTIIAILAILTGVVGLIGGIAIAAFSSMFASLGFGVGGLLASLGYIIGGVVIFFGIIWLLTGWGFLEGKGWARTLGLIFSILSLLGTIVVAASGSIGGIVGVVIWILMLYYLFTPPVKAYFRNGPSAPSLSSGSPSIPRPSIPTSFANPMGGSSSSFGSGPRPSNAGSSNSNRFCTNCGATLSAGSNRCSSCGTSN